MQHSAPDNAEASTGLDMLLAKAGDGDERVALPSCGTGLEPMMM
jgi:hypothetical protein